VSPLLWTQKQDTGPSPRLGAATVFDVARGRTVLFGGTALTGGTFGDTWEWDGDEWTQVEDTGPDARSGHDLAFDAGRGRVVLFGGKAGDGSLRGDTWEWDGTSWTQLQDTGPDARTDLRLAYDAPAASTVLFGGLAASAALRGDTWLWDGATWTQAQDAGPAPRHAHVQAYDAARGEVVLFGGETAAGVVGDTWAWDGTAWTQEAHFGPPPAAFAGLVFDGTVSLLYGGVAAPTDPKSTVYTGTWQWDGAHWTQRQDIGPGPRSAIAIAFDSARSCAIVFGGVSVSEADPTAAKHLLGDTWEEQGVPPIQLTSLSVNPDTVAPGGSTAVGAYLSQRAPAGGAVVVVTASGGSSVPNVDVPAGATSASVLYAVPANAPDGDVTLTGQLAGSSATATLHVTANAATMASFTINPSTVPGNQPSNVTFSVTLTAAASQGGASIDLSVQGQSFASVAVAAGSTTGQTTMSFGNVPAGTYQVDAKLGGQTLSQSLTFT
jgi:hypothetical protein